MPVSDFTVPLTREFTFASTGRTVKIRDSFPMQALVRSGTISDDLLDTFDAIVSKGSDGLPPRKVLEVSDLIAREMILEPRIGTGEGETALDLFADSELDDIVLEALLGAKGAARFRAERERDSAGDDGEDVAPEPVGDSGAATSVA